MIPEHRRRLISWGALAVGVVLFAATLYYIDFRLVYATGRRLGIAVPLALLASGLWHLARTWAWAWCFPQPRRVSFARLARVRLAAEAFSYLTLRGIAGEPLKVVLLSGEVDSREATAAVALERIAYLVGTTLIVGIGSVAAIAFLPLSHLWFRVFRAFAIGAAVIGCCTALVLTGRGTYLRSALQRIDRASNTHLAEGRVARFASEVERQLLELIRGSRSRLAVLAVATIAAYLSMAAEAWVILRAVGVPISLMGATAIETFSRVASFASAFIPANLGALEASSVAAVAAVGAAGAGAPLALARRIRGIFWAGLGLAIYPRRPRSAEGRGRVREEPEHPRPILLYLPDGKTSSVSPFARVAGLPIAERVLRSAMRAGYGKVIVLPGAEDPRFAKVARAVSADVRVVSSADEWRRTLGTIPETFAVTAIGGGTIVSPALLADAAAIRVNAAETVDVPAGTEWPISGVIRISAADALDPVSLRDQLRSRSHAPTPPGPAVAKRRARLTLRIDAPSDLAAAEETIRLASYKDTDNTLARFNRRMSLPISIALIRTPLTANQLSVALVAIGFYSAWLFSLGHYVAGMIGAFLSLAASVLDGCDGEIARLKYQESALGCWIETVGDYSYYIAIFVGLTIGAVRQTGIDAFYWIGLVALAGTLVTFALLIFLRSRITAGQPERLHAIGRQRFKAQGSAWSRVIWRISFVATRSAMPYGIMALAVVDALPLVVVLAAIGANTYWISLAVKLRHLLGGETTETVAA
jgi:phosphatidylglycerophosphate synthase